MTGQFDRRLAAIDTAMRRFDSKGFFRGVHRLSEDSKGCGPEELTALVERLAPMLRGVAGNYSKLAVLAGALVERGASPMPLCEVLPERAVATMVRYLVLQKLWKRAAPGRPLPETHSLWDTAAVKNVEDTLMALARREGRSEQEFAIIAYSWFTLDDWIKPLISAMMLSREFRAGMDRRAQLAEGADALKEQSDRAHWLHGLCLVLDDEPLIVLDPVSGRGFRLTMTGVGDNYQLHTLLADRLIGAGRGGLLDAQPPERAWVEAAATARPGPFDLSEPILRRFRLFDGHGSYIAPEGWPAEIAPLDGVRVLVLHPPKGIYGWNNGRAYENMLPTLTLDGELEPTEAARWLARIAPARETDVMGYNSA